MRKSIVAAVIIVVIAIIAVGVMAYFLTLPPPLPDKIRVGYEPFISGLPVAYIRENKLDVREGLKIEWVEFPNPDDMNTAFGVGQLDVELPLSIHTAAEFRGAGRDIVLVGASLRGLQSILVKTDLPYKSLEDLKGKVYAVLDLPDDVSPVLEYAGLPNLEKSASKVLTAPPPVLPELLAKGEADAIAIFDPFTSLLIVTGKVRELADVNQVWKQKTGFDLVFTGIGVQSTFLNRYPEAVKKIVKIWNEAVDWIHKNPDEAMRKYASLTKLPDSPDAIAIYKKRIIPLYLRSDAWNIENVVLNIRIIRDAGAISKDAVDDPRLLIREVKP
jgi:NitT/TauT family transport system substrate-binding protein